MTLRRPVLWRRFATHASIMLVGAVYLWFWAVTAHRIDELPLAALASSFQTRCGDFEHFYQAALAMREGGDLYGSGMRGYIYPPLIAFLFMPLTLLSVKAAAWLMLVVNLALVLFCTWVASSTVARRFGTGVSFDKLVPVVAVTTLLSATRLRSELQMWQTDVLMLTAVLLALRFLDARPRLAGLLLGLAVNVKYLPLVFLPYLLLRRRWVAAAWFIVGIGAFAVLPATWSGWNANLDHWATASSGLARLFGLSTVAARSANVDPITAGYSLSITSAMARHFGPGDWVAGLASALIALATLLVLRAVYGSKGKAMFVWPNARMQEAQPYAGMVALECAALMTLALAFSPQTNPRHTSLLLMVFAPLAAMLCFPRPGSTRTAALLAAAILYLGFALPPHTPEFASEVAWWGRVGGAGWCMVAMLPFLFVAGFDHLDALAGSRSADRTGGGAGPGSPFIGPQAGRSLKRLSSAAMKALKSMGLVQ